MLRAVLLVAAAAGLFGQQPSSRLPSTPLYFGVFTAIFGADGTFTLEGDRWPAFRGTWKADGTAIEVLTPDVKAPGCDGTGRYHLFHTAAGGVSFELVEDACTPRRMILDGSVWRATADAPAAVERRHEQHEPAGALGRRTR